MTPIEQEIEKLAEKHALNPSYMSGVSMPRAALRELIPLIREECAKIAEQAFINDFDSSQRKWAAMDIAAAIREGK